MRLCSFAVTPSEYRALRVALKGGHPTQVDSVKPVYKARLDNENVILVMPVPAKARYGSHYRRYDYKQKSHPPKQRASSSKFKLRGVPGTRILFGKPSGPSTYFPKPAYLKPHPKSKVPLRNDILYGVVTEKHAKQLEGLDGPLYRKDVAHFSRRRSSREELIRSRKKRSPQDEADEPVKYIEELGFGLSSYGGLVGEFPEIL